MGLLVVRCCTDAGADAVVYRLVGSSLLQIGNPFSPTTGLPGSSGLQFRANLAVEFRGDLYCRISDEVRRLNTGTGAWDVVHTVANQDTVGGHSGMWVGKDASGLPVLVSLFFNETLTGPERTRYYALRSNDGTTWTETLLFTNSSSLAHDVVAAGRGAGRGALLENSIFLSWSPDSPGTDGQIHIYDIASESLALDNPNPENAGESGSWNVDFAQGRGRLFAYAGTLSTAPNLRRVYEFVGGTFAGNNVSGNVKWPDGGDNDSIGLEERMQVATLFHDGADLFLIDYCVFGTSVDSNANGFQVARVDLAGGGFTLTDISSIVVPDEVAFPNGPESPGLASSTAAIFVSVDTGSTPGSTEVTIAFRLDTNKPFSFYRWNGEGQVMTRLGTGLGQDFALVHNKGGGGEYSVVKDPSDTSQTTLLLHAEEFTRSKPGAGQVRITFALYGDAGGGANKIVQGYFGINGAPPIQRATLVGVGKVSGAAPAPTFNGGSNQGEDFTADDDATRYFLDWDAQTDGVLNLDLHRFQIVVSE